MKYGISKNWIEFQFYGYDSTEKHFVGVKIDVNNNGIIDNMLDRSYGITTSEIGDNKYEVCRQYLIDEQRTTSCGDYSIVWQSKAFYLSLPNWISFNVPISELITKKNKGVVHISFVITGVANGSYIHTKYPDCARLFEKVYAINI